MQPASFLPPLGPGCGHQPGWKPVAQEFWQHSCPWLLNSEWLFGIANDKLFTSQRHRIQSPPHAKMPSTQNLSLSNPSCSFPDNICFLIVVSEAWPTPSQPSVTQEEANPSASVWGSPREGIADYWSPLYVPPGSPQRGNIVHALSWMVRDLWNENPPRWSSEDVHSYIKPAECKSKINFAWYENGYTFQDTNYFISPRSFSKEIPT